MGDFGASCKARRVHVTILGVFADSTAQLHKSGVQSNCQALLEVR